jgi:hypothetical protein
MHRESDPRNFGSYPSASPKCVTSYPSVIYARVLDLPTVVTGLEFMSHFWSHCLKCKFKN